MGKSNPTYRNLLEEFCDELEPFRRTAYRRHQEAFDRVLEHAREHSAAAGQVNHPDSEKLAMFSMIVGRQDELLELRRELVVEVVKEADDFDIPEDKHLGQNLPARWECRVGV